ncbi:MAG: hypothetical protein SGI97_05895 [candidate division Zixibacteria bacterium]|nr:hypothetical protein [candidate division Zixibacteria bacterium]
MDADIHDIRAFEAAGKFFDLTIGLKPVIKFERKQMLFKPVLSSGIGSLPHFQEKVPRVNADSSVSFVTLVYVESTALLIVKSGVEIVFLLNKKTSWMVELVVMGAPRDFSSKSTVRFGPALLFRAGLLF